VCLAYAEEAGEARVEGQDGSRAGQQAGIAVISQGQILMFRN
jgi:hypothetical protein